MAPPHILNWLKQAAANYVYQDQTTAAIAGALDRYPSLKIKTEQYTFDDGRTLLLLCLHGTLPITYSSARYNVPVAVWLPLDSPRSPPMVYVVPTSGMLVRKGRGVELDGHVNEDEWGYLQGWRRKWEAHSILPLLQSLVDAFSLYPPVYAKPAAASAAMPTASPVPARAQPSPSTSQVQPPTHSHNGSEHLPQYTRPASSSGQPPPPPPPPPPPLPPIPGQPPAPAFAHGRGASYGPPQGFPRSDSQGSLGPPPGWQQHAAPPRASTYSPGYAPPASPLHQQHHHQQQQYGRSPSPYQPPPHPQQQHPHPHQQFQPPHHAQRASTMPPPQHGGPPPPHLPQSPLRAPQSPAAAPSRPTSQPPPPRQPIPDLLSADDDAPSPTSSTASRTPGLPPPPPPPNPETLLLHSTLHATLSAALDAALAGLTTRRAQLGQIHDDLASARPAIEDEMARLRAVRDVCRGVGERLGSVVGAGDERLAWLEQRGEVGVDEVVCSTTIVYNQLVDLVAEDAAISDTIYQLNRALHAERIDLERFLKMTRILARDQFRCRALVEKILRG